MNYAQTLEYLYSQLPMYHRTGAAAYKANLDNTLALDTLLQKPHEHFKTIHVGGTNGKGSVSHMLAAVLQQSGYKTGLFTSPHLKDFRERIKVNGRMIPKKYVTGFVLKHQRIFDKIKPSFFEWTTALAFDYFRNRKIDIGVIEVGLGGRLDSTNIIHPVLSVITNVSFDHTDLLGNTLKKIAAEKAGIIKAGVPVVIGETRTETKSVFKDTAQKAGSIIYFADQNYSARLKTDFKVQPGNLTVDILRKKKTHSRNVVCGLTGKYQLKNLVTFFQCIEVLKNLYDISENSIFYSLRNVTKLTGIRGRWQIISKAPLTICDTAHNEAGIEEVMQQLQKIKYKKLHIVFGVAGDKDLSGILNQLPGKAIYYFCKANIPRGMEAEKLVLEAGNAGLFGRAYSSVKEAYSSARLNSTLKDVIFIGGSTFIVGEVL